MPSATMPHLLPFLGQPCTPLQHPGRGESHTATRPNPGAWPYEPGRPPGLAALPASDHLSPAQAHVWQPPSHV